MSGSGDVRSGPIRVMVVDDHPMWRDGVRTDLERDGTAEVVAEAGDGAEAVERATATSPQVVVMDLNLPVVSGVEATRRIAEVLPDTRILVLSASGEERDVLEAVKAGASGYLLKSSTAAEVADAVRRTAAGEPVFTPSLAALVLGEFRRLAERDPDEPALTPREQEVLRLVAKGYTYREIAERLFISVRTAQNHVQNILTKLQLRRRYDLMRYAIEHGLDGEPDGEPPTGI